MVVEMLRAGERPVVDPGLAGGLREWLEDEFAAMAAEVPSGSPPIFVSKQRLTEALRCDPDSPVLPDVSTEVTAEIALGALVDALFRVQVTRGELPASDGALRAGIAALEVMGDSSALEVVGFVRELPAEERERLGHELQVHLSTIARCWPRLGPRWLPRTQEKVRIPFAGGRVQLSGVFDLALGLPPAERCSVCLVEVKSGKRRVEHKLDLCFYALLETLRSGAPPFKVATFYTATGELDADPITEDLLVVTVRRVIDGAHRLARLESLREEIQVEEEGT